LLSALPLPDHTRVTVVTVSRPYMPLPAVVPAGAMVPDDSVREIDAAQQTDAERISRDAAARLAASGRRAEAAALTGDPAEEVLRLAEERGADLIVTGARGASLIEGLLVGSVADRMLKSAECSVLIAR
jgi:nucleotide-binding universal stress UspA family protein